MSLVISEVTKYGIAMVADQAISEHNKSKNTLITGRKQWKKLLKVPKLIGAVSYWGDIGLICGRQRFDGWLQKRIDGGNYSDLSSFADFLADELNKAAGGRKLLYPVGLHVAGIHAWGDGVRRPTFFHVHNGHGCLPRIAIGEPGTRGYQEYFDWQWAPRTLFERHDDYPDPGLPVADIVSSFETKGYLTRNGDIGHYIVISEAIQSASELLNLVPNVKFPKNPGCLGSRVGYLHFLMNTVVNIYKISTIPKIIGGTPSTIGIYPDGTYLRT